MSMPATGLGAAKHAPTPKASQQKASQQKASQEKASQQAADADARRWVQDLYRRQVDFVWRSLRGLGVPEAQTDDAVQEVFIVVYRRRHDYREDRSEKSWLFRIARFVAKSLYRTQRRKGGFMPLHEESATDEARPPDEQLALKEAADGVLRFLDTLDDDQRNVFVSMELAGLNAPETAEALEVKLNTVYSRLRLARGRWQAFVHDLTAEDHEADHD